MTKYDQMRNEISDLKSKLRVANDKIVDEQKRRERYLDWCINHFKWQMTLLKDKQVADVQWVMLDLLKLFNGDEYSVTLYL